MGLLEYQHMPSLPNVAHHGASGREKNTVISYVMPGRLDLVLRLLKISCILPFCSVAQSQKDCQHYSEPRKEIPYFCKIFVLRESLSVTGD
jgi:hypothetical protein